MEKEKKAKFPDYFKFEKLRNDKRVIVFMICLLISTILWFLNALSKEYDTTIDYPVKYVNIPKNRYLANTPPEEMNIKVRAHGFTLLRHKLHLTFTPIVLNVNSLIAKQKPDEEKIYSIRTSSLNKKISNQISNEIDIIEIQPEILTFVLDSLKTKEVPVFADIDITFKEEYDITAKPLIKPDMVEVSGPTTILMGIDSIYTEKKSFKDVGSAIKTDLSLIVPEKTELKTKKVSVQITVEEFTEKVISVPVLVENKPDSVKIKFFPGNVKVSFMIGLSKFSEISAADFIFIVPYEEIQQGKSVLEVKLIDKPDFIKELKYTPQTFEYLIEKN